MVLVSGRKEEKDCKWEEKWVRLLMKLIKKYLLPIIILALLVGFLLTGEQREQEQTSSQFRYQVDRARVVYYQGQRRWDLQTESIVKPKPEEEENQQTILRNIKDGRLYDGNKLEYEVDADEIIYFEDTENMELRGNVRFKEIEGKEITADKLQWSAETEKLTTEQGVTVKLQDGKLTAEKMELDTNDKVIDFTGKIKMNFAVKGVGTNED
jgi:LPS export ABC transporter protein LptC